MKKKVVCSWSFIKTYMTLRRLSAFPKFYAPNHFEEQCYSLWEKEKVHVPPSNAPHFSMILPPPNVTGTLHLGHALTICTQDTLVRWRRMCGQEVVWVPGMDHAGIATQVIVEKALQLREGKSRHEIGKDQFINEVWRWKKNKSDIIRKQLRKLGASLDWPREVFTMDPSQSEGVREALVRLWDRGLIYRSDSLVNWSPELSSAISDIEVEHLDIHGPTSFALPGYSQPVTFGTIVDFAYKDSSSDEEIVVSTTRVETMLGDVAIAVHPEDERYRHLVGRVFIHPFTERLLPLVLDHRVDPKFGTGAVKITPSHDLTDFQIAKTHNLPKISVINEKGLMENNCGAFAGLRRFEARERITERLASEGLLRGSRPHQMRVPICSRTRDVVELLVRPQWFVKCKDMANRAIAAVKDGQLIIKPEKYCNTWFSWLENIEDWCISRQVWWGHQTPFYLCRTDTGEFWVGARSIEEAHSLAMASSAQLYSIERDPDVIDTWFSSALMPFSVFGWPKQTEDLSKYYPLNVLVTGNDILFFWVARMVMLGLELTDQLPFKEVLLHGIICDSQGRKMSKSLGNVIDPNDVIEGKELKELKKKLSEGLFNQEELKRADQETSALFPVGIPECGVDSLRFTLLSNKIQSQYVNFDIKECYENRLFCNKLWQACNFALSWTHKISLDVDHNGKLPDSNLLNLMEKWILEELNEMVHIINKSLGEENFYKATTAIHDFVRSSLCDVYIEGVKPLLHQGDCQQSQIALQVLLYCLLTSVKCLAPIMPFICEQLYQRLSENTEKSVFNTSYPTCEQMDKPIFKETMQNLLRIVQAIRRLKLDYKISNKDAEVWISTNENFILSNHEVLETLSKSTIKFDVPTAESDFTKEKINEGTFVNLRTTECIKKEKLLKKDTLEEVKRKLEIKLDKLLEMTSHEGYQKAPERVQKSNQFKISKLVEELRRLDENLSAKCEEETNR